MSFLLSPTPRGFRLREPYQPPLILTFSVVRWCSAGASTSDSALPSTSEELPVRIPPNQGRPLHLPVRAHEACRPRRPSAGLTSPFVEVDHVCPTWSSNATQPEHPFRCRWSARLVRAVGLSSSSYSRFASNPRAAVSAGRDASCQPLQSTSFHENSLDLQLPGSRLAPPCPLRPV